MLGSCAESSEAGALTIVQVRSIVEALLSGPYQGDAAFYVYEVIKLLLKLDADYGLECFYKALHRQPWTAENNQFAGAYQIEEVLRQLRGLGNDAAIRVAAELICPQLNVHNVRFFPSLASLLGGIEGVATWEASITKLQAESWARMAAKEAGSIA